MTNKKTEVSNLYEDLEGLSKKTLCYLIRNTLNEPSISARDGDYLQVESINQFLEYCDISEESVFQEDERKCNNE